MKKIFTLISLCLFAALGVNAQTETVNLPYEETFASSLGKFTTNDVTLPEGATYIWKIDTKNKCAKASAFVNSKKLVSESWIISPIINLASAAKPALTFSHTGRYFGTLADEATLWVREGETGDWTQITIPTYMTGTDWNFVDVSIDLSAYKGKNIQLGFRYTSTTAGAGTWEIKNLKVEDTQVAAPKVNNIAEFRAAETGTKVEFANPVTVTYQNAKYLYVKDETGAMLIFGAAGTFVNGDVIPAGFKGKKAVYNGTTELTNVEDLGTATAGDAVEPEVKTVDQIDANIESAYVLLKGVTIGDINNKNFTYNGTLAGFNQFAVDLSAIDAEKKYDVKGMVALHTSGSTTTVQVMPVEITEATSTGIEAVAAKAVANVTYYNVAGMASATPFVGLNFVVTTYADGTKATAKLIK